MIKQVKQQYGGMIKDFSKSQSPGTAYYDAMYCRTTATDNSSEYSLTNERGPLLDLELPSIAINATTISYNDITIIANINIPSGVYNNTTICGNVLTTKGLALFTISKDDFGKELNSIWIYKDGDLTLLYTNRLNFKYENYITAICNYETEKIEKIYWVDGINQLRFINIHHSIENGDKESIYEINPVMLDAVAPFKSTQPRIKDITTGGQHTAGVIQYAYSLYKVNGSQTSVSTLSEPVSLVKTNGGGAINERVESMPIVEISDLDLTFDNIIIYSIKYTSTDVEPTINIINDIAIPDDGRVIIYDYGNKHQSITLEEFLFLGSDIYIPSDIEVKFNRLFMANYYEKTFKFDLDLRAFSFDSSRTSITYHNVKSMQSFESSLIITKPDGDYPLDNNDKFDTINLNYDKYKYQSDGKTLGGSGRYCNFYLTNISKNNQKDKYFKDDEIYRIGVVFYNAFGKPSEPIWVSDFRAPSGNLEGKYNTLGFELTSEFYSEINKISNIYYLPTGYKVVIAERNDSDKTIIASGLMSSMMINTKDTSSNVYNLESHREKISIKEAKLPNILMRNCVKNKVLIGSKSNPTYPLYACKNYSIMSRGDNPDSEIINARTKAAVSYQYNKMVQMYSPEATFNKNISIPAGVRLIVKGAYKNTNNSVWAKETLLDNNASVLKTDGKAYGGMTIHDSRAIVEASLGDEDNLFDHGLISHPGGSNPNADMRASWYRQYGRPVTIENGDNGYDPSGYKEVLLFTPKIVNNILIEPDNPEHYANTSLVQIANKGLQMIHNVNNPNVVKVRITTTDMSILSSESNDFNTRTTITYFGNSDFETVEVLNATSISEPVLNTYEYLERDMNGKITVLSNRIKTSSDESNITIRYNIKVEYIDEFVNVLSESLITVDETNHMLFENNSNNIISNEHYQSSKVKREVKLEGVPELTFKGQSFKNYSNLEDYRYTNNMVSFSADGQGGWKSNGAYGRRLVSMNTDHADCITMVLSDTNIENLYDSLDFSFDGAAMYGELIKSDNDIYLGGLYGGNRFEDKKRTRYREIGGYNSLSLGLNSVHITSPGDTFVQIFRFLRMSTRDINIVDQGTFQLQEILEYPCETSIDLINRNDESTMSWDSKLTYLYNNYHEYNNIYTKHSNITVHQGLEYYVKDEDLFGATVIPSHQKSAGETVDSWLKQLPNDALSLDGRFGSIQKMVNFNDQIFVFQNKAIAQLSIAPRVQVATEDGIGLQLGTGGVLPEYNYITQTSGTYNKYSLVKTPYGVYYYDDLNESINVFNGQLAPISETSGLHSYLQKQPLKQLIKGNPRLSTGVISGYDTINRDVYITFNYEDYTDTLVFNEKRNMFISREDDYIKDYIQNDSILYGTQTSKDLNKYGAGDYNKYYGKLKDTKITFSVSPESDLDTIINNIMYKSEVYKDGVDQPENTITGIRVYNEYQDSGLVPIVNGRRGNARRFFRDWNVQAPRNKNTRQRVRNPWNYVELTFKNSNNLELILHDVVISYSI